MRGICRNSVTFPITFGTQRNIQPRPRAADSSNDARRHHALTSVTFYGFQMLLCTTCGHFYTPRVVKQWSQ